MFFWEELVDPVTAMIERAIESGTKRIMISDPDANPSYRGVNLIGIWRGTGLARRNSRYSGVI